MAWRHQTGLSTLCQTSYIPCIVSLIHSHTKTSIRILHFLKYMFVLSTKFLYSAFKMSINWPVAVILWTFNWKSKENWSSLISSFLYLLLVCLLFCGFKVMSGEWSWFFQPKQSLCKDELLLMWVASVQSSSCLLSQCVSVAFWLYCKLIWQTFLFLVTIHCDCKFHPLISCCVSAVSWIHCRLTL